MKHNSSEIFSVGETGHSEEPEETISASTKNDYPFGYVDYPSDTGVTASNSVLLQGWALDKIEVRKLSVEREPRPGDKFADLNERGLIHVGMATLTIGERPDVSEAYPGYPFLHRAIWNYELKRGMISKNDRFIVAVHVIAHNSSGLYYDIGRREIDFQCANAAAPYLFCGRPFDSVFIDSSGEVFPYPDCRPEKSFGSLSNINSSFDKIWFGDSFSELRNQIIDRNPPPMCLTCAHFINRSVDDDAYFLPR